jgi:hypothetical protein
MPRAPPPSASACSTVTEKGAGGAGGLWRHLRFHRGLRLGRGRRRLVLRNVVLDEELPPAVCPVSSRAAGLECAVLMGD